MPAWRLKALPNSVGVEKPTVLPISAIVRVNNTTFDYRLHSADASIAAIPEPVVAKTCAAKAGSLIGRSNHAFPKVQFS